MLLASQYIESILHWTAVWLDMYYNIIKVVKTKLNRKIDKAMLPLPTHLRQLGNGMSDRWQSGRALGDPTAIYCQLAGEAITDGCGSIVTAVICHACTRMLCDAGRQMPGTPG